MAAAASDADCFPFAPPVRSRIASRPLIDMASHGRGGNRFLLAPGYRFAALLLWLSACRFSQPAWLKADVLKPTLSTPKVLKQGERFFGQCA